MWWGYWFTLQQDTHTNTHMDAQPHSGLSELSLKNSALFPITFFWPWRRMITAVAIRTFLWGLKVQYADCCGLLRSREISCSFYFYQPGFWRVGWVLERADWEAKASLKWHILRIAPLSSTKPTSSCTSEMYLGHPQVLDPHRVEAVSMFADLSVVSTQA